LAHFIEDSGFLENILFPKNNLLIILIKNWTVYSGYVGEDFEAITHGRDQIICTLSNGNRLSVPEEDFKIVYEKWNEYLTGESEEI